MQNLENSRPSTAIPTNKSIVQLLEFVLTKNNFKFDEEFYLQIYGTCMGSKCAPSYADLYMAWFESQFIYSYHLQPLLWVRFLDDCFCVWQHGREELDKFLAHLNDSHPTIKFTMEASKQQVNFLDTTVYVENNLLKTDLYCKPTDSHNYLLYSSAHPQKCKDSIPYGQFLRVRRICTKLEDFD